MAIKAQNQVTILDITDAYSVVLSNENQTFRENSYNAGVPAGTTTTTTVYSYRGSTNVYSFLRNAVTETIGGQTHTWIAASQSAAQQLQLTINVPTGLKDSGSFTVPIELYETSNTSGSPLVTINKTFSYSIARYGNTGQQGVSPTIYELEVNSVIFNYDNATQSYVSPQTITISAISQTGDSAIEQCTDGILRITRYSSNGTAGDVTLVNLENQTGHTYSLSPNSSYLYYIVELNIGGTISGTTLSGGDIVDKQTITTCIQGADGEDAYAVDITSSNGFVFKNTAIGTTLYAHVYNGGAELTDFTDAQSIVDSLDDLHSLGLTINWYEGTNTIPVASNVLTKTYTNYTVTDLLTVTAKLETYTPPTE